MEPTDHVLMDVQKERVRQLTKGFTPEHDDTMDIAHLIHEAGNRVASKDDWKLSRKDLVEGAALLVAAIEMRDRQEARAARVESAGPEKGFWNGMQTEIERGSAIDTLNGARIPVVRVVLDGVNYGGGTTYLDDRQGQGYSKVTADHGSPRIGHRDVRIEEGSFIGGKL